MWNKNKNKYQYIWQLAVQESSREHYTACMGALRPTEKKKEESFQSILHDMAWIVREPNLILNNCSRITRQLRRSRTKILQYTSCPKCIPNDKHYFKELFTVFTDLDTNLFFLKHSPNFGVIPCNICFIIFPCWSCYKTQFCVLKLSCYNIYASSLDYFVRTIAPSCIFIILLSIYVYKYFSADLKYSKNTLKRNNNTILSNNQISETLIHKHNINE